MSWLFILNFFILQWFFVRLAKVIDTDTNKIIDWKFLTGIIPLTGWWNDFVFIK